MDEISSAHKIKTTKNYVSLFGTLLASMKLVKISDSKKRWNDIRFYGNFCNQVILWYEICFYATRLKNLSKYRNKKINSKPFTVKEK